jgi:hypothetical protein
MGIAVEKCPGCGTPYMSALQPGEKPADRFCYNCNSKASDAVKNSANAAPIGSTPSSAALSSVGEDLMLQPTDEDKAALITTHKQGNARDQIVGQIQSNRPAQKAAGVNPFLPPDAPEFEAARKPPLFTVASSIRLAILLVILVVAAKVVYSVYQSEFGKAVAVTAPPPPTPTMADVTKPPTPSQPIVSPPPAAPKPVEKKVETPLKAPTPATRPPELGNDGGSESDSSVKNDPSKGPGKSTPVNVADLISSNSRQKSRAADDEDPITVAKKTAQPTPPPPAPGNRGNPANDPTKPNAQRPVVGPNQPPVGPNNAPPVTPPVGPQVGPGPGPGQQQPPIQRQQPPQPAVQPPANMPQNTGIKIPSDPIVATTPTIYKTRNDMISGVTFLQSVAGWFCRDYDDAHSLRESNIRGRDNVIMLTPVLRTPAKLSALIEMPKQMAGKKPELILEVTNKDDKNSWWLHASVDGVEVLKTIEVKSTGAKPWTEVHIDLSNFTDRRFVLQLEVMPAQGKVSDYAGYMRGMRLNWMK